MIQLEYKNDQGFDIETLMELIDAHDKTISWDVLVILLENSLLTEE